MALALISTTHIYTLEHNGVGDRRREGGREGEGEGEGEGKGEGREGKGEGVRDGSCLGSQEQLGLTPDSEHHRS
jgi:hypothetical protein